MTGRLGTLRLAAAITGACAIAATVGLGLASPRTVFRGYLISALFFIGLPLGALAVLMIHGLTGGRWGEPILPPLAAIAGTLPVAAAFLLFLTFALDSLFPWAGESARAMPDVVAHKRAYLNEPFLIFRTVLFLAVWFATAFMLKVWRRAGIGETDSGALRTARLPRRRCAAGLIALGLSVTFFSVDWMMSLEPVWYSTIYGLLVAAGQAIGALALAIALVANVPGAASGWDTEDRIQITSDLGNILLGFILLWVYFAYMQYLIIWSGNLPHEIEWYLARGRGSWAAIAALVVLLQFGLPFALLLFRAVKRSWRWLGWAAIVALAGHLFDHYWLVAPAFHPDGAALPWVYVLTFVAVGGLWVAALAHLLDRAPQLPGNAAYGTQDHG